MLAFGAWDGLERCSRLHCLDAPSCTRAMLPLALERCSPLHQGDAPSCTKAMLSRAPKATGHIGSFWRKSSRASAGDLPARRRETFTQQQPDYSINTKLL